MSSYSPQNESTCRVCRAQLPVEAQHCPACGASRDETPAQTLRHTLYLLSELRQWEEEGLIDAERASRLRAVYERQADDLRAQITEGIDREKQREVARIRVERRDESRARDVAQPAASIFEERAEESASDAPPTPSFAELGAQETFDEEEPSEIFQPEPSRNLIETLTDPHTLRLLLYTGAAMLVVGVVIWLRDVLYLKLQEPIVQASLLATGTAAVTAGGWFAILRTRLRWTGRALTLMGSLLVPVNFWFLVRSGLIQNNGRAWMVCAICTALYASTAAFLGEKLYVYLAGLALVATLWALVYRADAEAFGMYALTLMLASLTFLHLSKFFRKVRAPGVDEAEAVSDDEWLARERAHAKLELWGVPLTRLALIGATLACLMYMPARLGSVVSLREQQFQFWSHNYDASLAALLFIALAYAAWFTARFIHTQQKSLLYTTATLSLIWTLFLIMDGLRLSAASELAALSAATFAVSLVARVSRRAEISEAFYSAGTIGSVLLVVAAVFVLINDSPLTFTDSAALALLAASFSLLSAPRLSSRQAQVFFGYGSVLLASAAFLVGVNSAHVTSPTLFVIADSAWLFALYFTSRATLAGEEQLSAPLRRTADAGALLLFLWASFIALISYVESAAYETSLRPAMFCALAATILYGCLRAWRDGTRFNATLASASLLILVAATLDSMQRAGLWPKSWPIALGVIVAAFALEDFVRRRSRALELSSVVYLVTDSAVVACAALWFSASLLSTLSVYEPSAGASVVVLLALSYWAKHAVDKRREWVVLIAAAHAAALELTLLIALRVREEWFATIFVLTLFPLLFIIARFYSKPESEWIARPVNLSAEAVLALATGASVIQAMLHLEVGARGMLAPAVAFGSIALVTLCASLWQKERARAAYFRAGVFAAVIAFWLADLRAGLHPWDDVEVYTAPVGIVLLLLSYIAVRRRWDEFANDTVLLLWTGSILLAGPLLIRALQFRLMLDTPAPSRDLITLFVSLALMIFSVLGRLRAPMIIGAITLLIELAALTLTSVDWLQVPLKVYLITVGALILIIWGTLEYRREQFLAMRRKLHEQRTHAREEFGKWR